MQFTASLRKTKLKIYLVFLLKVNHHSFCVQVKNKNFHEQIDFIVTEKNFNTSSEIQIYNYITQT